MTEFLNRQGDQPSKPQAIKENVVEGVLQNYLDQLLVTATQPQRVEKAIHIPDIDDQDADLNLYLDFLIKDHQSPITSSYLISFPA